MVDAVRIYDPVASANVVPSPAKTQPTSIRRDRISALDCQDPQKLADFLNRLAANVESATLSLRNDPRTTAVIFRDYTIPASGTILLTHNLNRRVVFVVTDWQTAGTTGAVMKRNIAKTTSNVLALDTRNAGTATIEVY